MSGQINPGHTPEGCEVNHKLAKGSKTRQILDMQDELHALVTNDSVKPLERAACARAWDTLEERLRILRGKPLPGQLQPDKAPKPKRRSMGRVVAMSPEQIAQSMADPSQGVA